MIRVTIPEYTGVRNGADMGYREVFSFYAWQHVHISVLSKWNQDDWHKYGPPLIEVCVIVIKVQILSLLKLVECYISLTLIAFKNVSTRLDDYTSLKVTWLKYYITFWQGYVCHHLPQLILISQRNGLASEKTVAQERQDVSRTTFPFKYLILSLALLDHFSSLAHSSTFLT